TMLANSVGMRNVLDIAAKWKAKFFQASTSVIYGPRPEDNHLFKEDEFGLVDHMTPRGCYDEGKRWAETMANTYADVHGLDVRIARIFRTFGPRMALYDGQMIPDFIVDALDGKDFTIYGDEGFRTSLTYVTDIIDGILRVMNTKTNPGPVNLGSDYDIKIVDVAQKILEMTGSKSKINYEEPLPFMRDLGLPDLTRAKELGWIPLVSLQQGLEKSIEYTIAHKGLISPSLGG
ncbi:NAD-dependent epimerase/dehydratase family protein, partial [Patescibacteria group bacterium]